jgi:hypothetical protein
MTEIASILATPLAVFALVYGSGFLRRPHMNHRSANARLDRYDAGGRVTVPILVMRTPESPSPLGNAASAEVSWRRRFDVEVDPGGADDEPSDWDTARLGPFWPLVREASRTPTDADTRRVRLRALGPAGDWLIAHVQEQDLRILDRAAES